MWKIAQHCINKKDFIEGKFNYLKKNTCFILLYYLYWSLLMKKENSVLNLIQ